MRLVFPTRTAIGMLLAFVLLLTACGGRGGGNPQAGGPSSSPETTPSVTQVIGGRTVSPSPTASTPGAATPPPFSWPSPSPGTDYLNPTSSPSPFSAPWTPEVPVEATVTPSCIQPGGRASLTVKTAPKAGIAYHAIYAGSRGGAQPPFGSGYGGNDKGFTDDQGRYSSSWIVSPQAPPGPARVDVIVGTAGDHWGYDDPPFWVADAAGRC